ncbi:MAG: hypothetical protein ACUVWX_08360 [Kiritimatiellia bacterium]
MAQTTMGVTNPVARLALREIKTLWKAPNQNINARQARFNRGETQLAWSLSNGEVMVHDLKEGWIRTVWKPPMRGTVQNIAWGPAAHLAACVRLEGEENVERKILIWSPQNGLLTIEGTSGAKTVTWRDDGKALGFATDDGLYHCDLEQRRIEKLAGGLTGWRPRHAPAWEDLMFVGTAVVARASGTMRWVIVRPGAPALDLGECRGVAPDLPRQRLYLIPWLAGPTKIPRGAGVAWINLGTAFSRAASSTDPTVPTLQPERHGVVPFTPGAPYWLVDVWDWHYPTTLRVTQDGKTITFIGVRPDVLSETPWREMCLWEVPADGSSLPIPVLKLGPPFKRIDVGDTHVIGWRPSFEKDVVLVDLVGRRAWRLPDGLGLQRDNTDFAAARLLLGAARGEDVVLIALSE